MTDTLVHEPTAATASLGAARRRRVRVLLVLAAVWLVLIIVSAVVADWLPLPAPDAPVMQGASPPFRHGGALLLGSDRLGRSELSRIVFGARSSLTLGVLATALGIALGGLLGMLAGYFRGLVDTVVGIVANIVLALPGIVLVMAITAVFSPSLPTLLAGLGFLAVPTFIRLSRAVTMGYANREFVLAARALGASHVRILSRELLPNILLPVASYAFLLVAVLIATEGALSYLGVGIPAPAPSWGGMIADGQRDLDRNPYLLFIPAATMFITIYALNILGDVARAKVNVREVSDSMIDLILRKIGYALIIVFGVTLMVHFLFALVPGGAAYAILGMDATPDQVAALNEQYGFNDPAVVRYFRWISAVLHGDLGTSFRTNRPVVVEIMERLPVTIELAILATLLSLLVAIPLALVSVRRPGGLADRGITGASSAIISVPGFLIGLSLVYVFGIVLDWLPILGWAPLADDPARNLRFVILPVCTLAAHEIAEYSRVLRGDLLTTLSEDFITVARATGVPPRHVLLRYALRPSSLTVLTLAGLNFGRLLGGTVIAETIYSLPGLGRLVVQSITSRDLPLIQGVVVFIALVFVVINILVDIAYAAVDPRVRERAARQATRRPGLRWPRRRRNAQVPVTPGDPNRTVTPGPHRVDVDIAR